ncbi:MAG: hypothetical protein WCJ30_06755 [Deltaproteobacteria bacterium]
MRIRAAQLVRWRESDPTYPIDAWLADVNAQSADIAAPLGRLIAELSSAGESPNDPVVKALTDAPGATTWLVLALRDADHERARRAGYVLSLRRDLRATGAMISAMRTPDDGAIDEWTLAALLQRTSPDGMFTEVSLPDALRELLVTRLETLRGQATASAIAQFWYDDDLLAGRLVALKSRFTREARVALVRRREPESREAIVTLAREEGDDGRDDLRLVAAYDQDAVDGWLSVPSGLESVARHAASWRTDAPDSLVSQLASDARSRPPWRARLTAHLLRALAEADPSRAESRLVGQWTFASTQIALALRDDEPRVRRGVARVLGRCGPEASAALLWGIERPRGADDVETCGTALRRMGLDPALAFPSPRVLRDVRKLWEGKGPASPAAGDFLVSLLERWAVRLAAGKEAAAGIDETAAGLLSLVPRLDRTEGLSFTLADASNAPRLAQRDRMTLQRASRNR